MDIGGGILGTLLLIPLIVYAMRRAGRRVGQLRGRSRIGGRENSRPWAGELPFCHHERLRHVVLD